MKYIRRILQDEIKRATRHFPALILTGPRRAGKTTLLRNLFPSATHVLLEDPDIIQRVRSDPNTFLDGLKLPVILDEIQNTPELFGYIRTRIDRNSSRKTAWLITGSQESTLMHGVTESMAGRAAVFHLLPLSTDESSKVSVFRGGFPEVLAHPTTADIWFRSYVMTYLERDVRTASAIRDLSTFRRFITLLASRCGQMLNKADLAAPLGVSIPTLGHWLSILELTGQIILVPPFFENFGKRLVKSPKIYFVDSGLACHLLGIENQRALDRSIFRGAIFEGFVASEIVKRQINSGKSRAVYYFRDNQGLEVDFIVPCGERKLALIEAKASKTLDPRMARPMQQIMSKITNYDAKAFVLGEGHPAMETMTALAPGIQTATIQSLGNILA